MYVILWQASSNETTGQSRAESCRGRRCWWPDVRACESWNKTCHDRREVGGWDLVVPMAGRRQSTAGDRIGCGRRLVSFAGRGGFAEVRLRPGPLKYFPRAFYITEGSDEIKIWFQVDQTCDFRWGGFQRNNCSNKIELRPTWNYLRELWEFIWWNSWTFYSERWVTISDNRVSEEIRRKVTHRNP